MRVPKQIQRDLLIAGGVGFGLYALRLMSNTSQTMASSIQNTIYVKRNPAFARMITKLYEFGQDELVDRLVLSLEMFLELSFKTSTSTQEARRYSREIHSLGFVIERELQDVLKETKKSNNAEVILACVDFVSDEEELFSTLIEAVVHNAMLDAS